MEAVLTSVGFFEFVFNVAVNTLKVILATVLSRHVKRAADTWDIMESITSYPTQSQYTDTGPNSPSTAPIMQAPAGELLDCRFQSLRYDPAGVRTRDLPVARRTP